MKLLKIIKHADLFSDHKNEDAEEYKIRKAARAVVFDDEKKIAILKVAKHNYHKLPGGGVEKREDLMNALEREMLEEIGCKVTVFGEVGRIIEHRDKWNIKQESFCYLANLVGKKEQPCFTKEETDDGFELMWVSLGRAIEIIEKDNPNSYDGKFIKVRDLCFLEEAKNI